jgi:hypothetical protein
LLIDDLIEPEFDKAPEFPEPSSVPAGELPWPVPALPEPELS